MADPSALDKMTEYRDVYVTCRCGAQFRPGQEASMWACVRQHVARRHAMEEAQRQIREAIDG